MNEEIKNDGQDARGEDNNNDLTVTKKSNAQFGVGGVGSLALIGLVIIVILTILLVKSQNREEDVLSFAPADSLYALEVENIEGAADLIAASQLWRSNELASGDIISELSVWLGSDGEIVQKFVGNIKSFTIVESLVQKTPEKMMILKVGNGWDIERYYKREYSKVATPVKFAGNMNGLEITRPDKSVFYLKKIANFVILAQSKTLMVKSLNAYKENRLSLAKCNVRFGDGEDMMPRVRLYMAINSFFMNYPERKGILPEKLSGMVAGDSAFLYEATLNATGFVAEGRVIRNEAAEYASGKRVAEESDSGFFATIFWIILTIIIIVIAIPVLFVIFTLLLALYFFLLAWWKGELVPIDPPLKDLSKNLKEDLGVDEKANADSPAQEQAADGSVETTESSEDSQEKQDDSAQQD